MLGAVWVDGNMGWVDKESHGASRGLLIVWNSNNWKLINSSYSQLLLFLKRSSLVREFFS